MHTAGDALQWVHQLILPSSSTAVSISFCTAVCNAGFKQVIKEAEQKAKAAAKVATSAAVSSPGKMSASTGKKGQAASAKVKSVPSAKHVTKQAQQSRETAPQPPAGSAISLGRALARAAFAGVVATGTKEAQQPNAAQLREQRYLARQWANPAQAPPEQQQGQGRGQDLIQHQGQDQMQEGQLVDLKSPTNQGGARSPPSLETVLAGQSRAKRRKTGAGLMESLANGGEMTSASGQVGTACKTKMFAGSHLVTDTLAQGQARGIIDGGTAVDCCH